MNVGAWQITYDDPSSISSETLRGRRSDSTGAAADERDLAL
jgi:hypothetical protein